MEIEASSVSENATSHGNKPTKVVLQEGDLRLHRPSGRKVPPAFPQPHRFQSCDGGLPFLVMQGFT